MKKMNIKETISWCSGFSKKFKFIVTGGILAAIIGFFLIKFFPNNLPPEAKISASQTEGEVPFNVDFDAQKSTDPEGNFLKYLWYINDINVSTDKSFNYIFNDPNSYKVTLTVEDPKGLKGSDVLFIQAIHHKIILQKNDSERKKTKNNINEQILSDNIINTNDLSYYANFSDEQKRRDISNALKVGEVNKAIKLLKYLHNDKAKDDETEVIFNYCIANKKLEKAKVLIKFFSSDSLRYEAQYKLSFELRKK